MKKLLILIFTLSSILVFGQHKFTFKGGASGSGIQSLGTGYGLVKVNDSTYKADTSILALKSELITPDYVVTAAPGNIYNATARGYKGNPSFSGISSTVLNAVVNQLRLGKATDDENGGTILIEGPLASLSVPIEISGWTPGVKPSNSIKFIGDKAAIYQAGTGDLFKITNGASVEFDGVNMSVFDTTGGSVVRLYKDTITSGATEIAAWRIRINNCRIGSGSKLSDAVILENFFEGNMDKVGIESFYKTSLHLRNNSTTTNFGNSDFGIIGLMAPDDNNEAGLKITSLHPETVMNLNTFKQLNIGNTFYSPGQPNGNGIYIDGGSYTKVGFADIEYMPNSVVIKNGRGNSILDGYIAPDGGNGTGVKIGPASNGNYIAGTFSMDATTAVIVSDSTPATFATPNEYKLRLQRFPNTDSIKILGLVNTKYEYTINGSNTNFIHLPGVTVEGLTVKGSGSNGDVLTRGTGGLATWQPGGGGGGSLKSYAPLVVSGDSIYNQYNILAYGADATGTLNSTSAVQAAINAAALTKGTVYVPAGTYKIDSVHLDPYVSIQGEGYMSTIFKANSALPMFNIRSFEAVVNTGGTFNDFQLDGNSIGTIGFNIRNVYNNHGTSLYVHDFTTANMNWKGVVASRWDKCLFVNAPINVLADSSVQSNPDYNSNSNLNSFYDCALNNASQWAFKATYTAGNFFYSCDIESNGTSGDLNTGSFYFKGLSPSSEGVGASIINCWLERNHGTHFYFDTSYNAVRSNIQNTLTQFPAFGTGDTRGVYVAQGASGVQSVEVTNSTIDGFTTDLSTLGTNAVINSQASTYTVSSGNINLYKPAPEYLGYNTTNKTVNVSASRNGVVGYDVQNTSAGASALGYYSFRNDMSDGGWIGMTSSGYGAYGVLKSGDAGLYSGKGINIGSETGQIDFGLGSNVPLKFRMNATGLGIGVASPSNLIHTYVPGGGVAGIRVDGASGSYPGLELYYQGVVQGYGPVVVTATDAFFTNAVNGDLAIVSTVAGKKIHIGNNNTSGNVPTLTVGTGQVGIGTVSPSESLQVVGNILASGTIVPSDRRYKQNIKPVSNALSTVMRLKSSTYEYNIGQFPDKGFNSGNQFGLIAQDVEKVLPDLVTTYADGYKGINYTEIIPLLIKAIQEQQAQIDELKKQLKR